MKTKFIEDKISKSINEIDDELSKRLISLDPTGYFIIKLDFSKSQIIAEHYSNHIDELGRAINPENGKPIACNSEEKRSPISIYRGKTAKAIGIQISEGDSPLPISRLDHALYLGRELQRAETCLSRGEDYIQD